MWLATIPWGQLLMTKLMDDARAGLKWWKRYFDWCYRLPRRFNCPDCGATLEKPPCGVCGWTDDRR
jgi:hypothetical protein